MDAKKLLQSYLDRWSWDIRANGGKQARNDIAQMRRTSTALKKLMDDGRISEILEPQDRLALTAAVSVLSGLTSAMERVPAQLDKEQKRMHAESDANDLKRIDAYLAANSSAPWAASEDAAKAELALLDEFRGHLGKDWIIANRPGVTNVAGENRNDAAYGASRDTVVTAPSYGAKMNFRQQVAVRLTNISPKSDRSSHSTAGVFYYYSRQDYFDWRASHVQMAETIRKISQGQPAA